MNEKIKEGVRNNFGYYITVVISLVYLLSAFITIDKTGKSIYRIIADGAVAFVFGFCMNKVFEFQGIRNAEREERLKKTLLLHEEWVMRISPEIDRLDLWCEKMNEDNLKKQRTRILSSVGLSYSSCFDEVGNALPYTPLYSPSSGKKLYSIEKKRAKTYEKAVKISISTLCGYDLTSNGNKNEDPFYFGRNKIEYEKQTSKKQVVFKLISSTIFGYYGVRLIDNFSYAVLIWTALQISLFVISGVIRMYSSYNFMTDEYRSGIIKKIDLLQKFDSSLKKSRNTTYTDMSDSECFPGAQTTGGIIESEAENEKKELFDGAGFGLA